MDIVQTSADYRRQARQIRKLYADRPHHLYHYLGRLAKDQDSQRPAPPRFARLAAPIVQRVRRVTSPFPTALFGPDLSAETVSRFSESITGRFDGPVLRYSQRRTLMREADRMGIGGFHANLIIALTQYRHCANMPARIVQPIEVPPRRSRLVPILAAVVMQAAIIVGIWLAIR